MNFFNEDCLLTLERFEDNFLDLTLTSPPYNVGLEYDEFNDLQNYDDYLKWLLTIFSKVYQKTKTGGRCVINVGDQKNGQISLHSDVIHLMNKIGWLNYTIIFWDKGHTNNRTAWGSYLNPSSPSFPRPIEYVLVFAKETLKLQHKGETDLIKEEFVEWSYGLWKIKPETKKIGHPAAFPLELPKRLIKMLTYTHDVVFDPFAGSGTTGVVCKLLNRQFYGSEISKNYFNLATKRIKETFILNQNYF